MTEPATKAPSGAATAAVLVPVATGALVAVALGVYGRLHEPTFFAVNVAGFTSGTAVKVWLTSAAFLLALVQLWSSAVLYGRLGPTPAPSWTGGLHRWSGRVLTAPVAVHCLFALGFQSGSPRVLLHSLCGCLFYGAFVAKMLLLARPGAPGWSLPAVGGAVFTGLTALWLSSSLCSSPPPASRSEPGREEQTMGTHPGPCAGLCGDPHLAEDAVQEVFLRAWRACPTLDPVGPPLHGWLSTVLRNVVIDQVRARACRPPTVGTEPTEGPAHPGDVIATLLLRASLVDALALIDATHRDAVLATVVRDRPYPDVAVELRIPVGTVKSRVVYGLRKLRAILEVPAAA